MADEKTTPAGAAQPGTTGEGNQPVAAVAAEAKTGAPERPARGGNRGGGAAAVITVAAAVTIVAADATTIVVVVATMTAAKS